MIVNIHEAKTQRSRLVERAAAGEEIVIGRGAGGPSPASFRAPRIPGRVARGRGAGRVTIADDIDATPESVTDAFEGG